MYKTFQEKNKIFEIFVFKRETVLNVCFDNIIAIQYYWIIVRHKKKRNARLKIYLT